MTTLIKQSDLKRAFKENYKLEKPKYTTRDGLKRKCHDVNGLNYVDTGVVHSPIDVTDIRTNKVKAKLNEIKNWFRSKGGLEEETGLFTFNKGDKKEFTIYVASYQFIDTYEYDGYMGSYIYVGFK